MKKLKIALGVLMLPLAFVLFAIDRCISSLTPQKEHPEFNKWLGSQYIVYAMYKVTTIIAVRYIVYWIFNI